MIEHQYSSKPISGSTSWSINELKKPESQRIIRKFINSAIYVEKAITGMPPLRKTSSISVSNESYEHDTGKIFKKCTCISTPFECSCHPTQNNIFCENATSKKTPESGYKTSDHMSSYSSITSQSKNSFESEMTIKPNVNSGNINGSEIKLSLSYLNTDRTCTLDNKEKAEIVKNWLAKKEQEKKQKDLQELKLAKAREEKRQRQLEKERENFKKWLDEKRRDEERKRIQKEVETEEKKLREAEKEKKKVENEISFNLWLRKKKKTDLERKIREKMALLHIYEEKEQRMENNERAYEEWLKSSKNRQKPIQFNKGLQSLCSSQSVTYINPIPWNPNIELNQKPSSQ